MNENTTATIAETCPRCHDTKTIKVLGCGGDYEFWPCPVCRKPEMREAMRHTYSEYGGGDAD